MIPSRLDARTRSLQATSPWRRLAIVLAATLFAMLVVTLPGCGGCRKTDESMTAEELKKKKALAKKEEKKPDFEIDDLETLPSDDTLSRNYVKPGHAVTAWVPAVANHDDLRAEFETSVTSVSGAPMLIGGTQYHLVMSRPAVLPKGQRKFLESTFYIPGQTGDRFSNVFLRHELKTARGGRMVHEASQITNAMSDYQYVLAVLSTNPNAFGYVKQLESIEPHHDLFRTGDNELVYYRVVIPSIEQRVPLPSQSFSWTMIAYLLWDGLQPAAMPPGQQQAMIDWLHWGGQLIVSGPSSIDSLTGSFLDPYLPATADQSVALGSDDLAAMDQSWSLEATDKRERLGLTVLETAPLVGVTLQARPGAEFLDGTGQQVAERRVGRGRVVVTAFPLTDPAIVNWGSFDSFFNGCLLRRPPRLFESDRYGAVQPKWMGEEAASDNTLYVTATRYFTRDIGSVAYVPPESDNADVPDWHSDGYKPDSRSGLGGWNDESGASKVAYQSLKEAAGISIPEARFVLSVLVIYLVVLVPVNWFLFRLLGRVEWAWVAAPVIAIVGAVAVIQLAQLDIGFVRSRTEIAVLEMHGGYSRAHLTRFTALYSSLSSNYELRFEEPTAMAQPFPATDSPDAVRPVVCRRDRDVELTGFQVRSNTTGFLHSEQMFETGRAIQLIGDRPLQWQIQNDSDLSLHHVGVLYRAPDGRVMTCWIDQLAAKTTVPLSFVPAQKPGVPWLKGWDIEQAEATGEEDKLVANLQSLTDLAALGARLQTGDVRLIGWLDGFLPGLTITPSSSQTESSCVVLVHLKRGPLSPPRPDANTSADVRESSDWDLDLEGVLQLGPGANRKKAPR